jgi:preprotein translocase subunit SecB
MSENDQAKAPQREFGLQRIYTKDISFETPNSPDIFKQEWKPESSVNLSSEVNKLADDIFEVVLTITLTTKIGDKTAYLAEVQQGGIFFIRGFPEPDMGPMLGAYCPNALFPYAREVISDLVTKGSFPQMLLTHVNFDALYAQHQQKQAAKAEEGETTH